MNSNNLYKRAIFIIAIVLYLAPSLFSNTINHKTRCNPRNSGHEIKEYNKGCFVYKSYDKKNKSTYYDIVKLSSNGKAYIVSFFAKNINNATLQKASASEWNYKLDSNLLILHLERPFKCITVKQWDYYKVSKNHIYYYRSETDYEVTHKIFDRKNINKRKYKYCDTLTAMPMIQ